MARAASRTPAHTSPCALPRVARLDKEAAERDAREREIADELAAAQRRNARCKDAVLTVGCALASATAWATIYVLRR